MVAILLFGVLGFAVIFMWRNYSANTMAVSVPPANVSPNKSPVTSALVTAGCTAGGGPIGGATCNALLHTKYGGAAANGISSVPQQVKDIKWSGDGSFTSGLEYAVEPWRW